MNSFFKSIVRTILIAEAKLILKKYRPSIVAITGSVGKTSTKDAIFNVFSETTHVRKSDKSYNSDIGLPLTIIGAESGWRNPVAWMKTIGKGLALILWKHRYPQWLILEVGVRKPGDMKETASWLKTNVVVITAFADIPSHIEFFKSAEELFAEKVQLIQTLIPEGLLVLNADDKRVMDLKESAKHRTVTFGTNPNAMAVLSNSTIVYENNTPVGMTFRIDSEGSSIPVVLRGLLGRSHMMAAGGAMAVAMGEKMKTLEAAKGLERYSGPPGRLHIISGIKDTVIIDDTYNSSPLACQAALEVLHTATLIPKAHRIAVMGDMLELGRHTKDAHEELGKWVKKTAHVLVAVGVRAKHIVEGARAAGMKESNILHFADAQTAGKALEALIHSGDVILVKGSQGMRMERVVEEVMAHPEDKEKLLVRQEFNWLNKA